MITEQWNKGHHVSPHSLRFITDSLSYSSAFKHLSAHWFGLTGNSYFQLNIFKTPLYAHCSAWKGRTNLASSWWSLAELLSVKETHFPQELVETKRGVQKQNSTYVNVASTGRVHNQLFSMNCTFHHFYNDDNGSVPSFMHNWCTPHTTINTTPDTDKESIQGSAPTFMHKASVWNVPSVNTG